MIPTSHRFLAVAALVAAALPAQLTIRDGNMAFTTAALSATSHTPRAIDLQADALAVDHALQHGWYYRLAGDSREFSMRDIGPMTSGVTPFLTHADTDLADVDGRGLMRAALDFDTYAAGPASGVVTSRLTLLNTSATVLTLDLFCYTDLDIGGTFANDMVTGSLQHHVVTDWTGVIIDVHGVGADHSDVLNYPTILNALTNSGIDNLTDALPPYAGDYTGAFQWSGRTLTPGEQRSFTVVMAVNTPSANVPGVELYGVGSHLGCDIYTDTLPLQDNAALRQFGIHMSGGLPLATVGLLSGTVPAPGTAFAGVQLWVDFATGPVQFALGNLDGSGYTQYVFVVPSSPYLTGFPIYHQYFYVDPGVAAGASHTAAILTRLGRL